MRNARYLRGIYTYIEPLHILLLRPELRGWSLMTLEWRFVVHVHSALENEFLAGSESPRHSQLRR